MTGAALLGPGLPSQQLLRDVLDAVPAGIAVLRGDDFLFELVNPAYQAIDPTRRFVGQTVAEAWPDLAAVVLPLLRRVVETGTPFHADDMALQVARGGAGAAEERFFSFTYQRLPVDDAGRPGVLVTVIETSVQVRARQRAEAGEARAATERERLAVTVRSIGDAVIATDTEARIQVFNRVAEQLTGWKAAEAVGQPLSRVFRIVHAGTRAPCEDPVSKVLGSGKVVALANHTLLIARDGTERAIADSGAPIHNARSETVGVVLVFRDVTETERRDAALAGAQRLEALAVVAGGIAHDFNNLLTGVLANLALALEEQPEGAVAELLGEAGGAARRARGLTQQLLTFAKGGAPAKQLTDLAAVVRETAEFCTRGWRGACRFELPTDLWHAVVDPGQLGQVVQNVVINAVEAMPKGGTLIIGGANVVLDPGNEHELPGGSYALLRIEDDGPGIPAALRARIFEPFFTTKATGSGLGLAVCQSILARHDGRIEARPRERERGTRFDVLLPARPGEASGAGVLRERAASAGGRVLIVDDEELIRSAAVRSLRAIGCEVHAVRGSEEALALFEARARDGAPFDVVLLDLTIPGGEGGPETLAALRRIDPAIRAIVSSGFSSDPVLVDPAAHGFAGALVKPYDPRQLREEVGRVLAARRAPADPGDAPGGR